MNREYMYGYEQENTCMIMNKIIHSKAVIVNPGKVDYIGPLKYDGSTRDVSYP